MIETIRSKTAGVDFKEEVKKEYQKVKVTLPNKEMAKI